MLYLEYAEQLQNQLNEISSKLKPSEIELCLLLNEFIEELPREFDNRVVFPLFDKVFSYAREHYEDIRNIFSSLKFLSKSIGNLYAFFPNELRTSMIAYLEFDQHISRMQQLFESLLYIAWLVEQYNCDISSIIEYLNNVNKPFSDCCIDFVYPKGEEFLFTLESLVNQNDSDNNGSEIEAESFTFLESLYKLHRATELHVQSKIELMLLYLALQKLVGIIETLDEITINKFSNE